MAIVAGGGMWPGSSLFCDTLAKQLYANKTLTIRGLYANYTQSCRNTCFQEWHSQDAAHKFFSESKSIQTSIGMLPRSIKGLRNVVHLRVKINTNWRYDRPRPSPQTGPRGANPSQFCSENQTWDYTRAGMGGGVPKRGYFIPGRI